MEKYQTTLVFDPIDTTINSFIPPKLLMSLTPNIPSALQIFNKQDKLSRFFSPERRGPYESKHH